MANYSKIIHLTELDSDEKVEKIIDRIGPFEFGDFLMSNGAGFCSDWRFATDEIQANLRKIFSSNDISIIDRTINEINRNEEFNLSIDNEKYHITTSGDLDELIAFVSQKVSEISGEELLSVDTDEDYYIYFKVRTEDAQRIAERTNAKTFREILKYKDLTGEVEQNNFDEPAKTEYYISPRFLVRENDGGMYILFSRVDSNSSPENFEFVVQKGELPEDAIRRYFKEKFSIDNPTFEIKNFVYVGAKPFREKLTSLISIPVYLDKKFDLSKSTEDLGEVSWNRGGFTIPE